MPGFVVVLPGGRRATATHVLGKTIVPGDEVVLLVRSGDDVAFWNVSRARPHCWHVLDARVAMAYAQNPHGVGHCPMCTGRRERVCVGAADAFVGNDDDVNDDVPRGLSFPTTTPLTEIEIMHPKEFAANSAIALTYAQRVFRRITTGPREEAPTWLQMPFLDYTRMRAEYQEATARGDPPFAGIVEDRDTLKLNDDVVRRITLEGVRSLRPRGTRLFERRHDFSPIVLMRREDWQRLFEDTTFDIKEISEFVWIAGFAIFTSDTFVNMTEAFTMREQMQKADELFTDVLKTFRDRVQQELRGGEESEIVQLRGNNWTSPWLSIGPRNLVSVPKTQLSAFNFGWSLVLRALDNLGPVGTDKWEYFDIYDGIVSTSTTSIFEDPPGVRIDIVNPFSFYDMLEWLRHSFHELGHTVDVTKLTGMLDYLNPTGQVSVYAEALNPPSGWKLDEEQESGMREMVAELTEHILSQSIGDEALSLGEQRVQLLASLTETLPSEDRIFWFDYGARIAALGATFLMAAPPL